MVRAVAWKGKVFNPERGELHNLIGPPSALAIRAQVFPGKSWFDREESIILALGTDLRVAHWRDRMIGTVITGHRPLGHTQDPQVPALACRPNSHFDLIVAWSK